MSNFKKPLFECMHKSKFYNYLVDELQEATDILENNIGVLTEESHVNCAIGRNLGMKLTEIIEKLESGAFDVVWEAD
jgi:hypothetical protein